MSYAQESKSERVTATVTPSEKADLDELARARGQHLSRLLRDYSIEQLLKESRRLTTVGS